MSGNIGNYLNLNWKTAAVFGAVIIIITVLVLSVPGCAEAEILGIKIKKCADKIEQTSSSNEGILSSDIANDIQVAPAPRLPSILTAFNQSSLEIPPAIEKNYLVGDWNFTGTSNDLGVSGIMVFDDTGRYRISAKVENSQLNDFGVYQLTLENMNEGRLTLTSASSNITKTYDLTNIDTSSFTAETNKERLEFNYQSSI